ncbi:hypothetical protein NDU88_003805 [Pleurodeles waltl]|uniref:Uncharacterized protein n=1 Tax=Pleurodeles waltl TaxID=8319 RepID=A0AAV7TQS0_PLEWA|nr:hypothetical protein NDU88_003805 [Pleurodeles waltl]
MSKIQRRIVAGTVGVERRQRLAQEAPGLAGTRETVPHERCGEWLARGLGGVVAGHMALSSTAPLLPSVPQHCRIPPKKRSRARRRRSADLREALGEQ